jgi:glycosyltransferase involved in cell wall biosynthesis
LSLLEGASMCKTLIATDTAGCREIIEDGVNGYLCRKKDGKDLAEKMERYYYLSPEEKKRMGLEGREKILDKFTEKIVTDIYLDKLKALGITGKENNSQGIPEGSHIY